jgi:N-acetylmuramoyl-L-alanine amidase
MGADIFISLHINNFREKNIRGFEVYYRENKSEKLAKLAAKNLEEIALIPKRRIKKEKYLMLKETNCPSILIESEYLSNKRGRKCILDTIPNIEMAVVKTIEEYFQTPRKKSN